MHALDEEAEYLPALQMPVTAERPVVAQYDPPGHVVHAVDPTVALYLPASQVVQGVAPAAEYVPEVQAEQVETPLAQQNDAPAVTVLVPVGHEVQTLALSAEKVLRAHDMHAADPEVE